MTHSRIRLALFGAAAAAMAAAAPAAHAGNIFTVGPLTVDPDQNRLPPTSGTFSSVDLSGIAAGTSAGTYLLPEGITLDLGGVTNTSEGVVWGSLAGEYAAPITDHSGTAYAGNFLSTGVGSITLSFAPSHTFAFLWGSVDDFNTVTFNTVDGPVSINGSEMPSHTGSQGYGGSFYTLVTSTDAFTSVTLGSTTPSFEAAAFEVGNLAIAEPASVGLLGIGVAGLALLPRRRRA